MQENEYRSSSLYCPLLSITITKVRCSGHILVLCSNMQYLSVKIVFIIYRKGNAENQAFVCSCHYIYLILLLCNN